MSWIDAVTFDADGLVPAIVQDADTHRVLMFAFMNREALQRTIDTGEAVFWSRSRGKLWHKGETSGHTQKVHEVRLDCDADVVLVRVTQVGGIACHTGRERCFYRKLDGGQWVETDPVLKDPKAIYG